MKSTTVLFDRAGVASACSE